MGTVREFAASTGQGVTGRCGGLGRGPGLGRGRGSVTGLSGRAGE